MIKLLSLVSLTVIFFAVGCGRNESEKSCAVNAPEKDMRVVYTGTKNAGTDFKPDKEYFGHVVNLFKDGSAEVLFDGDAKSKSVHQFAHTSNCATIAKGTRVKYVGTKGRAGSDFPIGADYFGTVVTGFSNSTYEVKFEHTAPRSVLVGNLDITPTK